MNDFALPLQDDLSLLLRLFIAHLLSDFVFQSKSMAQQKQWNNRFLYFHLFIVAVVTALFTVSWIMTVAVFLAHGIIDSVKGILSKRHTSLTAQLFFLDQIAHIISIISIWIIYCNNFSLITEVISANLTAKVLIIATGYVVLIWPMSHTMKFALKNVEPSTQNTNGDITRGGNLIGIFERIIILTFMLLESYEAIGFLITGKSIIRFAQTDEKIRSEYVLLGTMLSYSVAIVTGALILICLGHLK